jgi:hypothetical protein
LIAVNSLLLFLVDIICRSTFSGHYYWFSDESHSYTILSDRAFLKHWKCLPCLRAPPCHF